MLQARLSCCFSSGFLDVANILRCVQARFSAINLPCASVTWAPGSILDPETIKERKMKIADKVEEIAVMAFVLIGFVGFGVIFVGLIGMAIKVHAFAPFF